MGLRETLEQAVAIAFTVVDNIPVSILVRHFTGAGTRNATTGAWTRPSTEYTDDKALKVGFTDEESRANVQQATLKFFGQRSNVLLIDVGDEVDYGGKTYNIVNVKGDPLDVTYTAFLKEAG